MNFSELIKTKRKENDITQEILADMIGTSKQTIANWENDRSKPQINDNLIINSISHALKISKSEIIESITGLKTIKENEENIINYSFLPNELMNIKLSKEEIEVLFAMEYFEHYSNVVFVNNSNGEFRNNKLQYNDYINIFNSGRHILSSRRNIGKILSYININVLTNIIRKNNLTTFNIQHLSEEDIYTILKSYKDSFMFLLCNDKELCYFKDGKICNQDIQDAKLVLKNEIYKDYYDKLCIKNEHILTQPYIQNNFNNYFVSVELVPEKDTIEYNAKLEIYNEELQSWERKMVEIKKLQDLYDSEKYPDLPKPEEPKLPKKKLCYQLNYKGILLKKFFEKMEKLENNLSDFVENARVELAPYLDKEVSAFGTLVLEENNAYLFKSIYIDGKVIDHLWVYDIEEILNIGKTYELNGTVHIYTKEVDEKSMKNYGIKVNKVKEI